MPCSEGIVCPHHQHTALMNRIIEAVPPALTVSNVHLQLVQLSVHILQNRAHNYRMGGKQLIWLWDNF